MRPVAVLLAAATVASCAPAGSLPAPWAIASGSRRDAGAPGRPGIAGEAAIQVPPIVGRIDLSDLGRYRRVQAEPADVVSGATVTLQDTSTDAAVATTLTDSNGSFTLTFGSYTPVNNRMYTLEVVKGLGSNAVGRNAARVRTRIRFDGTQWQSLTTGGGVSISVATTALAAAHSLKVASGATIDPATLLGKISGGTYDPVEGISSAEFDQVASLVTAALVADLDPLADLNYDAAAGKFYRPRLGNLAPGDTGDPAETHDFVVTKSGVQSTFVWIPLFRAYQLIVPSQCGPENDGKPVGYWVASQPSTGSKDVAWARETFGGFYAGKYEASHANATPGNPTTGAGATEGNDAALKVARYCVPWTGINWDDAALTCMAYDSHCHLLRDDEWTALAVWATIHGVTVYGNNNNRQDVDDASITFLDDPTYSGSDDRALTGSAASSNWGGATNLTAHTGTTAGVFDLNGNVYEWTATVGQAQTSGNYIINDTTLPGGAPGDNFVGALSTDPRLRRFGLPAATTGSPVAFFGGDSFWKNPSTNTKNYRGGDWGNGGSAGLWCVSLSYARTYSGDSSGFRPALSF